MESSTVTIRIKRYSPGLDGTQRYEDFEVEVNYDATVLDALHTIKDTIDGSLSYRWSCRMAICGSCGMMVNGKPVLSCATYIRDLPKGIITVEPLRNFPVIKDLVSDIDDPMEKFRGVMPYVEMMQHKMIKDGEYPQTPEQLSVLKQTSQCIKCMLCYSACPVYGMDKNFVGPAAGALAYRYQVDSRDQAKKQRALKMISKDGVYGCSFVGECSLVCPKRVDPGLALQRWKLMGLKELMKMAKAKG